MRLTIPNLDLAGALLLVVGLENLLLDVGFACYDSGCGSAAGKAAVVADLLARDIPLAILSAAPVTVAWIVCLVQLVRTGHRGVAVTLALVLPFLASVSVWLFHTLTLGTWRLDILAADDVSRLLGLVLLWPVATFVASFAPRKR
jgi:hypothetical protein